MFRDFCLKTRAVPRSWAWGSLEGHWESLLGRGQEGFLESVEGASLSLDFCSRGFIVVEGFPLPGLWSLLPSHIGIRGAAAGASPTSPNSPPALPACLPQGLRKQPLYCSASSWSVRGKEQQPLPFSPSEGLQLLPSPLGLPGPYRSSPRPDWPSCLAPN